VAELGGGFRSGFADVNGTRLHYVRGGDGPAVLLLHGFPEDWFAFRDIMPKLAEQFSVVAVDLRGIGRSRATDTGYDAGTLAKDVQQLLEQLAIDDVYVVGHDVGGFVGYVLARRSPDTVRGAMLLESPLPGIGPWAEIERDPRMWHVGFHKTPRLPDRLIAGREFIYLREGFLTGDSFTDEEVRHFARAYAAPDGLNAGLGFYRALDETERVVASLTSPTDDPFVLVGSEEVFAPVNPQFAEAIRASGAPNVTVEAVADSGHYIVDDQPEIVTELIERHAASE